MPYLVGNFLRVSQNGIANIKNARTSRSRNTSRSNSRNASRNASPHSSDGEDNSHRRHSHSVKMPDLSEALRKSLHLGHIGRSVKEAAPAYSPISLDWTLESPPIVLHGTPDESTGAMVSGQMFLDVKEDFMEVDSFLAKLSLVVSHKRPFHNGCGDCQTQHTTVGEWSFLSKQTTLRQGRHAFPFSVLIPGNLPASANTSIVSIDYVFKAKATLARDAHPDVANPIARWVQNLEVNRSLPEPLYPHNSVRIFPPTNIKATTSYPSTIYPTCNNKMTMKLDGLMTHNEKVKTVDLWKLKKLTWRLEETVKTVAPACEQHNPGPADSANRGLPRSETRTIGEKCLFEGWKSDFTGNDGIIDMEFDFGVNQLKAHANELKYTYDTKTSDGTEVTHSLWLELVVSKEYAQVGKMNIAHQTGTGRILRMHFSVVLTHNSGLSLSWDEEAPPIYEDVPPRPPAYEGPELELEDLYAATAPNSRRPSHEGVAVIAPVPSAVSSSSASTTSSLSS